MDENKTESKEERRIARMRLDPLLLLLCAACAAALKAEKDSTRLETVERRGLGDDDGSDEGRGSAGTEKGDEDVDDDDPSAKPDKSFLMSADDTFLDFFVDRFKDDMDEDDVGDVPPTFIFEKAKTDKVWRDGVGVPEHLDFVTFNLWHGNHENVTSYFEEDIKIKTEIANKKVVKMVKVSLKQETTTMVDLEFECISQGSTEITVRVKREKFSNHKFKLFKECTVSRAQGLLISTQSGELAFHDGKIMPAFNIHDRRGVSFIASKEDQTDLFYFHTYLEDGGFEVLGNPTVRAHAPTRALLTWIAKTSPGLSSAAEKYKELLDLGLDGDMLDEEDEEDAFEDADEDEYEEEEEEEEIGEIIDNAEDEDDVVKEEIKPEETPDEIKEGTVEEVKNSETIMGFGRIVCSPTLSGELAKKAKSRIVYMTDFGEKKLLGFASAGLLGMHGGRGLSVDYNCMSDGLAIITLDVFVRRLGARGRDAYEKIRMSWLKVCSAEQISPMAEIDMMGFNIHLGMYVREEPAFFPILNGITTEPFRWNTVSMIASPDEITTSFYVQLREAVEEAREDANIRQLIRIRKVQLAGKRNVKKIMEPRLAGHGAFGGVVTSDSLPIIVHYNCRSTGSARIGLRVKVDIVEEQENGEIKEIDFGTRVRTVKFFWIKHCAVTPIEHLEAITMDSDLFNLNFENGDSPPKKKKFSSVTVIEDGSTSSLFSAKESDSRKQVSTLFHVPASDKTFAIKLFKKNRHVHGEETAAHVGLRFNTPLLTSSVSSCEVSLRSIGEMEELYNLGAEEFAEEEEDAKSKVMEHEHKMRYEDQGLVEVGKDDPVFLVVDHECMNVGDSVITLQMSLYGNTERVVTLRWVKQCSYSDVKLGAVQTGGAVVFFVIIAVLITSALFCMALKRQRERIRYLQSKDKKNGFDRMDIVSSL